MTSQKNRHSTGTQDPDDRERQWTQVTQRPYDGEFELSTAIVYAIATARGVSPTEVRSPPLYECVDATTLETLFFGASVAESRPVADGAVEFRYAEFLVTVRADGWIQVFERDEGQKTS